MKFVLTATLLTLMAGCSEPIEPPPSMQPSSEAIEEAKRTPGGWVYKIVGDYGPDDAVPPEAIEGAWKVDPEGKITGDFKPNPNFRPPAQNGGS